MADALAATVELSGDVPFGGFQSGYPSCEGNRALSC